MPNLVSKMRDLRDKLQTIPDKLGSPEILPLRIVVDSGDEYLVDRATVKSATAIPRAIMESLDLDGVSVARELRLIQIPAKLFPFLDRAICRVYLGGDEYTLVSLVEKVLYCEGVIRLQIDDNLFI